MEAVVSSRDNHFSASDVDTAIHGHVLGKVHQGSRGVRIHIGYVGQRSGDTTPTLTTHAFTLNVRQIANHISFTVDAGNDGVQAAVPWREGDYI